MSIATPREVLDFWFGPDARKRWFASDATFDAGIRTRFEETWRAARAGKLSDWAKSREGALALIVVLDQFPRNMFRGKGEAFATDAMARDIAASALMKGFDRDATPDEKNIFYLPLMHSEAMADQERSVQVTRERHGEDHIAYAFALRHRDAIARFGRFPGRNAALGRAGSEDEKAFLAQHPAGF
jgi:uncharacterized protein (DUF924 family)